MDNRDDRVYVSLHKISNRRVMSYQHNFLCIFNTKVWGITGGVVNKFVI